MIIPNAEEDFPLPAPVWTMTMMRPFSPLFSAIGRSRAAFFPGHLRGVPGFIGDILFRSHSRHSFGLTNRKLGQMVAAC